MEPEPHQAGLFGNYNVEFYSLSPELLLGITVLIFLIAASALISGSEVAFFSFTPTNIQDEKERKTKISTTVLRLIDQPKRLLGTILVTNNFVNVGIVILSSYLMVSLVNFSDAPILGFIIQVVVITFLLLLFGEIIPKVYATHNYIGFARFMALPLYVLGKIFMPVSSFLIHSTSIVDRRIKKQSEISINDLSDALELTEKDLDGEKEILKGIVEFTNTEVKEIMRPRVDVVAIDISKSFKSILNQIIDCGYSRIPVYLKTFDEVKGILYIKDLLPHLSKPESFKWQTLIRPPYFVPENKKINDLLAELQEKKIHLAIIVDEYGGTSGIVTLEDILEEIVGEISDEFDEQVYNYTKVNDTTFLFEGKTSINDFCRAINYEGALFDLTNADTLAGFILEQSEEIPKVYEKFEFERFTLRIEAADHRRIKKIKVSLKDEAEN